MFHLRLPEPRRQSSYPQLRHRIYVLQSRVNHSHDVMICHVSPLLLTFLVVRILLDFLLIHQIFKSQGKIHLRLSIGKGMSIAFYVKLSIQSRNLILDNNGIARDRPEIIRYSDTDPEFSTETSAFCASAENIFFIALFHDFLNQAIF